MTKKTRAKGKVREQWDALIAHKMSLPASRFGGQRKKTLYIRKLERQRDGLE